MASCAVCLHKNVHPNVCSDCLGGTHFKPRNKTNADRIRGMSDEELAEWISCNCTGDGYGNSAEDWFDWLRQEANDEN